MAQMNRNLYLTLISQEMGPPQIGQGSCLQLRQSLKGLMGDNSLLNTFLIAMQKELP